MRSAALLAVVFLISPTAVAAQSKLVSPPQAHLLLRRYNRQHQVLRKVQRPPQSKPAADQQPAAPDQRGTVESPVIVKVLPPIQIEGGTQQNTRERDEKTTTEWWLAWFTGGWFSLGYYS